VQVAKFASEASVVVRDYFHVLTHWKHYKQDKNLIDGIVGKLSVSFFYPLYYVHVTV
jgi:hypothetical protein